MGDGGVQMAAVGCMRDNGTMEREEASEKEGLEMMKLCRKNGIHHDCFMAENGRDSLDSKTARIDRSPRVNGSSKSVSAIFTKPSIPTLRSRKEKITSEQNKRRRRLSKGECVELRTRCYTHDRGRMLGVADAGELTSCKYELTCEQKVQSGSVVNCSCHSSTHEICASASPSEFDSRGGEGIPELICKRDRDSVRGAVGGSVIRDVCTPLPPPPPPFPISTTTTGTALHLHVTGSGSSNSKPFFSSYSPLSSISSPVGSPASLFDVTRSTLARHHQPRAHIGSINNNIYYNSNGSSDIGSSSKNCIPFSSIALASQPNGNSVASSTTVTPTESGTSSAGSTASTPPIKETVACRWKTCSSMLNPADLLEHLRHVHVDTQSGGETFVCEWDGCKVAGKSSCSMSWLERHVVAHSGHRPYKCILPNCGARFPSQVALHRHVNGHFATESQPGNGRANRPRGEEATARLLRRRGKLRRRRPQCVRNGDFFDNGVMDHLQHQLWDLMEKTQLDMNGSSDHVTFYSSVIARKTDDAGKINVLLRWHPKDVLEDTWVLASQVETLRQRVIHLRQLPPGTSTNLHPSLYRPFRFRKYRRK